MRTLPSLAFLSVAMTVARVVSADCAEPPSYFAHVQGSTVVVSAVDFGGQMLDCVTAGSMLRQSSASGGVVTLAPYCNDAGAFVDECVPGGSYDYGLEAPFSCSECGAAYYVGVDVGPGDGGTCTRSLLDPGPTEGGTVPWGDSGPQEPCPSSSSSSGGVLADSGSGGRDAASDAAGSVVDSGVDSGADGGATAGATAGNGKSGCSVSALGATRAGVVALDGIALAVGALVIRRRRSGRDLPRRLPK